GTDELAVRRGTGVRDCRSALSADEKGKRAQGKNRQSESRSRSEAGLHSASFGGCAAETGSLVWGYPTESEAFGRFSLRRFARKRAPAEPARSRVGRPKLLSMRARRCSASPRRISSPPAKPASPGLASGLGVWQ